jgi:hypothetical protein
MKSTLSALFIGAAVLIHSADAGATTIEFEAVHLGGSLWQYDYFLADGLFDAQQGFAVFFDPDLFADLNPVSPAPDWDVLVTIPDPLLDSDGTYDALALVDNPIFVGPFSVSFTWLGLSGTTPGSQIFNVYTLDASGFPEPIEVGVTTPRPTTPVPEPSTLFLSAVSAVAGSVLTRWRRRRGDRIRCA